MQQRVSYNKAANKIKSPFGNEIGESYLKKGPNVTRT